MSAWEQKTVSLRTALLTGGAALGIFFLGVVAARATPGVPGGKTRDALSFAGTLRGVTGPQQLSFTFKKGGVPVQGCASKVMVQPDADGAFATELPLDGAGCPGSLFDGADVTLDVAIKDVTLAQDQAISPVPYARYADRVGSPDCPLGYDRDPSVSDIVVCDKGVDQIVKVGTGPSAFWVDRYEASVWDSAAGSTGSPYGTTYDNYPSTFPHNGQWTTTLYALSVRDVMPSRYLTWFQAAEACAASGKVLPSRMEWLRAAGGTVNLAPGDGTNGTCVTTTMSAPAKTGGRSQCRSRFGAEDMVGNLSEWTDEWVAGLGPDPRNVKAVQWPKSFPGDTLNITTPTVSLLDNGQPDDPADSFPGLPAAALRGGSFADGLGAGVMDYHLDSAPSNLQAFFGFRCVIRR